MARFGQADELVGAAIYLISDSSSYTTGETIIIDGGFLRGAYEVLIRRNAVRGLRPRSFQRDKMR